MTCVLLMIECMYGHYGMDPGIPNEATLHRCLLSDIPFVSVERQQHLSLFMKNYQSPFENMFIFPWFPTACRGFVLCGAFQLQQMCFHHLGHKDLWQCHTHSSHLLRIQAESFSAFNILTTRRWWVFSSPLMLCQYPPFYQETHH